MACTPIIRQFVNNNGARPVTLARWKSISKATARDQRSANGKMKRVNVSKKSDIRVISVFFVDTVHVV